MSDGLRFRLRGVAPAPTTAAPFPPRDDSQNHMYSEPRIGMQSRLDYAGLTKRYLPGFSEPWRAGARVGRPRQPRQMHVCICYVWPCVAAADQAGVGARQTGGFPRIRWFSHDFWKFWTFRFAPRGRCRVRKLSAALLCQRFPDGFRNAIA